MVKLEDFNTTEIRDLVRKYNKRVKIVGMSKLKKADLIKAIRQHPRITVIENDKGVKLKVSGEVSGTNEKKIKIKKDEKPKSNKIEKLDNEITNEKNKISTMKASELNQLSKKYATFKDLVGLDNKKHKGIVKAILKRQQELKKPNVPKITITEAEEEKGGGAAYPKSKLGPIPKPRAKIRIVPKKPKAQLGQSGLGQKRKREEGPPKKKKVIDVSVPKSTETKPKKKVIKKGGRFVSINQPKKKESVEEQVRKALAQSDKKIEKEKKKPKPSADDAERIPDMVNAIEKARKKGKPLTGLELQLKELMRDFDLSGFKLPGQKAKAADKPKEEKPKEEKPKKKKESRLQRIRRERAEAIERDKGKVISQVSELPKKAQTEFFKYLKEENEDGFTIEDQSDLYEYMEDLADRLPKERKARQELNQFDKEQMVLFNALFPKEYIQYIEVENDITGRKEGIIAAQEKKAAAEEARSQKARDKESRAIAKKFEKEKQAEIKQKAKDAKEFESYMKKNPFKN